MLLLQRFEIYWSHNRIQVQISIKYFGRFRLISSSFLRISMRTYM